MNHTIKFHLLETVAQAVILQIDENSSQSNKHPPKKKFSGRERERENTFTQTGTHTYRARLNQHSKTEAVSYTHLTLPTNREV